LFRFDFCFGFPACLLVVPVHVRKRGDPLKPAATAQFFLIASGCAVKNPSIVIQLAASSSPYDYALSTRQQVIQLLPRPLS
jgi:hypothetical protein